ncbi:MAG: hypothetical protein J3R72DRAFT_20916 [Linnemannia gamsii]|nr:MAG: hypothetical protein J3R72DRAFT_20916 [Linnemannia gamsii]
MLVDKVAQSNIRDFELHLREIAHSRAIGSLLRPGKGRYHSLLGLLSSIRFKDLTFTNVEFIGPRTSGLPSNYRPSLLQSFRYQGVISSFDDTRLAEIITHSPHLVDLRLGSFYMGEANVPKVDHAIGTLKKFERLHRYGLFFDSVPSNENVNNNAEPYGNTALRELVDTCIFYPPGPTSPLKVALQRSLSTLEVLMLRAREGRTLDLSSIFDLTSLQRADNTLLPRLTHLEFAVEMTPASLHMMSSLLPSLALVHVRFGRGTGHLLAFVNLQFLKSVLLREVATADIERFCHLVHQSTTCDLESIRLIRVSLGLELSRLLGSLRLRRLFLDEPILANKSLNAILQGLNFSQLEYLLIDVVEYYWELEAILASRSNELLDEFMLHLSYSTKNDMRDVHKSNARDMEGSSTRLACRQVRALDYSTALR